MSHTLMGSSSGERENIIRGIFLVKPEISTPSARLRVYWGTNTLTLNQTEEGSPDVSFLGVCGFAVIEPDWRRRRGPGCAMNWDPSPSPQHVVPTHTLGQIPASCDPPSVSNACCACPSSPRSRSVQRGEAQSPISPSLTTPGVLTSLSDTFGFFLRMIIVAVCSMVLFYVVTKSPAPDRRVSRDSKAISLPGWEGDGPSQ